MEQTAGQANAAVFAAGGPLRHRLVRALTGAGIALLAAWLIALALGVFGGFDSLPGLPSVHPKESQRANAQPVKQAPSPQSDPRPAPEAALHAKPTRSPSSPPSSSDTPARQSPTPKPSTAKVAPSPSTSTSVQPVSPAQGRGQGTTKTTTGKPVGSPGNGAGGSGAPGQLR